MNKRNTTIDVSYEIEGFHKWEAAPPKRAYLRNLHRHLFKVRVEMSVRHDDREVEFHDLLDFCQCSSDTFLLSELNSCEHHCENLITKLEQQYLERLISVSISEDGECGATVKNYD